MVSCQESRRTGLAGRSRVTREAILDRAARIISETGAASLTFQTLGETLGVTKQAIIYWFPSKSDLARELVVPWSSARIYLFPIGRSPLSIAFTSPLTVHDRAGRTSLP